MERIKEIFPHIGVVQVYGLTEGQPIAASLDPQDAGKKGGTVGKPMPLTVIQIVDEDGSPLPAGKVGEILIKSPAVSEGYWKKPEATMETFTDRRLVQNGGSGGCRCARVFNRRWQKERYDPKRRREYLCN
ncbi:AMP-binding protein [Weizmannia acidilactici]|uniref:AMP-binding protein n=1 Tax=Weizmannia acidilactici TaxID=2607726 RepID=UPI0035306572